MAKRDYYQVLGVARDADADALKKAYRRLAQKYHPDRNPDDTEAEEAFKEMKEAYEVLDDPAKRAAYDQFGHEGLGGPTPGYGYNRDADLEELLRRAREQFAHMNFGGGRGNVNFAADGSIVQKIGVPVDVMVRGGKYSFPYIVTGGGGMSLNFTRSMASVDLPADCPHGFQVKHPTDTDLTLVFVPESTDRAMVQGLDILIPCDFDALRLSAGLPQEVVHLDGTKINVKAPPSGLKQGTALRVQGKGLRNVSGRRGNLLVGINLTIPAISDDLRGKLEALLKEES